MNPNFSYAKTLPTHKMNRLLPSTTESLEATNVKILEQTEVLIWSHYRDAVMKLENRHKALMNDLIDEKMLIKQKLQQSLEHQLKHLSQLKLSLLYEKQEKQRYEKQQQIIASHEQSVKSESSIETNTYDDLEKQNDIAWNKCHTIAMDCSNGSIDNTNGIQANTIGIPVAVKNEAAIETVENDTTMNILNNKAISSINSIADFDINKTEVRMKEKINNYVTKIKKTKNGCGMKFKCTYNDCNKKFKRLPPLQDHIARKHIDEKPFKCNRCDKCFVLRRLLNAHENYHSSKDSKRHVQKHTGKKEFKCQYNGCDKSFKQKINLIVHQRTHTGERPFQCQHDGCTKSFRTKAQLVVHQRTHTGEKPFKCDMCSKKFTQSANLRAHKTSLHGKFKGS